MIALDGVCARAGSFALADVTFEVPAGGYGVVIGPAGAGKTTLLETIAGIVPPSAGRLRLDGVDRTRTPPEQRRLGMVYQHAYLFPHLTVRENVAYGCADERTLSDVVARLGLEPLVGRAVARLSGGERQLVALARALAPRPSILLLDEPFSALDPRTRTRVRRALRVLHAEQRFTVLQVTHDFAEAGLLGDVAIVLDAGRVVQQGAPEEVFRRPATPYIADFLGAENVFAGTVQAGPSNATETGGARALVFTTGGISLSALGDLPPGPAHAVLRAEEVSLAPAPSASSMQNQFRGRIGEIVPGGALVRVTVDVAGTGFVAAVTPRAAQELALVVGGEIVVGFKAMAVHLC